MKKRWSITTKTRLFGAQATRNINPETGLGFNNKRGFLRGTWEYNRNHSLLQAYGITLQEWEVIFANQTYSCKICGSHEPHGKTWHTDHNHETGKIGGILCGWCNVAIGLLQEDVSILQRAIEYLND